MQCPNCRKLLQDRDAGFCPHCGFELAKWNEAVMERLTPPIRRKLLLAMGGLVCLSLVGLGLVLWAPFPALYVLIAVASWYGLRFLARQIGLVDRTALPPELRHLLKWMGLGALLANVCNMAIFVLALIAFF